jgi:hypothetical protein
MTTDAAVAEVTRSTTLTGIVEATEMTTVGTATGDTTIQGAVRARVTTPSKT